MKCRNAHSVFTWHAPIGSTAASTAIVAKLAFFTTITTVIINIVIAFTVTMLEFQHTDSAAAHMLVLLPTELPACTTAAAIAITIAAVIDAQHI